ncbi:MAG: mannonate dehydratase [Rhodobacteraceae bacterium]|nr:mannonate dehydratase [Paracoccaceae bacterium]
MLQTWRWFGENDSVSINDLYQVGVESVVTALHHIPTGDVWQAAEISKRVDLITAAATGNRRPLPWGVVESLPVSEDIKKQSGDWRLHIANYKESLRNIAAAGIKVVCYNFMPVLDWTRTDLAFRLPSGATCMRFGLTDFAIFDICILNRKGAEEDYPQATVEAAKHRFQQISETAKQNLVRNIVFGLPGAAEHFSLEDIKLHLAEYAGIGAAQLRANLVDFLEMVAPVAQDLGMRLCCHPDDPPVPLMGLPRIMSTEADYRHILDAVDLPANGITLCSGSLGARPDNDLPGMMERLGDRVHFLHLRNVQRESNNIFGSFHEAEHLAGDTDMIALVKAVLKEEARRTKNGRADFSIPFRPDHGQNILDDHTKNTQPGYPAIGRLKGLAELRGAMFALSHID